MDTEEDAEPGPVPRPKPCADNVDCADETHSSGRSPKGYKAHLKGKYKMTLVHILLMLLAQSVGRDKFTCSDCPNLPAGNYHCMLQHMRHRHGEMLGCKMRFDIIKRQIGELKIRNMHRGQGPLNVCDKCATVLPSPILLILHFYTVHNAIYAGPSFCPLCHEVLINEDFLKHFQKCHFGHCPYCGFECQEFRVLMDHIISGHWNNIMVGCDRVTRLKLLNNARDGDILLPWVNQGKIILESKFEKVLLPDINSTEFRNILGSITGVESALDRFLRPYKLNQAEYERTIHQGTHVMIREIYYQGVIFQNHITDMLMENRSEVLVEQFSAFQAEVSQFEEYGCSDCSQGLRHSGAREECIATLKGRSKLIEFRAHNLRPEEFKEVPVILIGNSCFTQLDGDQSYPLLNLSQNLNKVKYATGYCEGLKVIFNPKAEHRRVESNYFRTVQQIVTAKMGHSRSSSTLFVLEFALTSRELPFDRTEVETQITGFLAEALTLVETFHIQVLILGPIRKYVEGLNPLEYAYNEQGIRIVNNMLVAMAVKVQLPVLPSYAEVTSFALYPMDHTVRMVMPGERKPLYNRYGTTTRHYREKAGKFIELGVRAWARTIKSVPHLQAQYINDVRNGGARFPYDILDIPDNSFRGSPSYMLVD